MKCPLCYESCDVRLDLISGELQELSHCYSCLKKIKKDANKTIMSATDPRLIKEYNSIRWKAMRKLIVSKQKYCQDCYNKYDIINVEKLEVHHIVPTRVDPNLFYVETNLVLLCKLCHRKRET